MKKILLAGASGYLGSYIAVELYHQSYPTKIVVRNENRVPLKKEYFETIVAEVTDPAQLSGIMNNVEVVFSTIGITRQKDGLTYMDVDYQANLNLLKEAEKAGVRKFIYVSALNADKLTHLEGCKAKELFVQALKASSLDYCIIRPNGFFSDMTEFMNMAQKGKAELFGDGQYKMNPIHGEDLAEVCVNAIDTEEKIIEVGGPEILTHNEIAKLAFHTLGKKVKISYMPDWMRKTILWFARNFTSSKKYGPMEFFFTVLSMDMLAPEYGKWTLSTFFKELKDESNS